MNRLKSLVAEHWPIAFVFLCVLLVYGLTVYKRQESYARWMERPHEYVVDRVTAMATMDAYWWLKEARDLDAGKLGKGLTDPTKEYPDLQAYPQRPSLLVYLISWCRNLTGGDYYRAGLLLVAPLAGLFIFPLFLYCRALGFGPSAVLGGLVGSFSWAYYSRSAMGFVDTDLLNLFFPIGVSALLVSIRKERGLGANLLLALAAGLLFYLFNWWYQRPLFILVYLPFVAAYGLLLRLEWKRVAAILLVFALASGPTDLWDSLRSLQDFLQAFFFPRPTGRIVWPNVMATIQEARGFDLAKDLRDVYDFVPVVVAGLAGLGVLYVLRFKQMLPITPVVLIGIWSLFGPVRFAMYLAPFVGVGAGVLIELVAARAAASWRLNRGVASLFAVAAMAAVFFPTVSDTAYDYTPEPAVPPATVKAFLALKRLVPRHAPMFTWWSRGYPLMEIGEFATYHDGSVQGGIRTTLIAKALTSSRQEDIVALLSCLEAYGFGRLSALAVEKDWSGDQLVSVAFNGPKRVVNDLYVLYMDNMISSFDAISTSGTWDFSKKTSAPMQYTDLRYLSHDQRTITCVGGKIDLDRGTISDNTTVVPLKAALFVKGGYVTDRFDYKAQTGVYLEVLVQPKQAPQVLVVEEPLFLTNFNQQYLLGNFDRRYFEEIYNDFPVARVLRVRKTETLPAPLTPPRARAAR